MADAVRSLAAFAAGAHVPPPAADVAARAFLDTIGVTLAGAGEPAGRAVQAVARAEGGEPRCTMLGTPCRTSAALAALANGTAAHALDYDDMCFVSLAHPSAPLVAAALAAGELAGASARRLLEGYVTGFEIEAVLGRALNPRHYQRGWHCTSTLGTIGAAACAARVLGLDEEQTARCLAIAASEASGLKENFGTMTKPLHAGLAARNGILAARLAQAGLTASELAIDGPQGLLVAMAGERTDLGEAQEQLGRRWEILETGITVKLYPSCAGTHPALDALLDLRRQHRFDADEVAGVEVAVDAITPTVLIYDRPESGLQGKFSMPFCAAAALVDGRVGIDTFAPARLRDPRLQRLMPAVTMHVDPALGRDAPPLTQAIVTVRLRDGRAHVQIANGARGYPARPASREELDGKFLACAERVLTPEAARAALGRLHTPDAVDDIRTLTALTALTATTA
ncbi:MAG TPA: MmgE/PrpD family protein [Vicinamibacterales bacterium]|nr:MmgE/PrpD family protein [Vicinamibacterales bacterium]